METDSILELLAQMFIFLLIFVFPPVVCFVLEKKLHKYSWKFSISIISVITLVAIYGYLRREGIIIYLSDKPSGVLWSDWYFNGSIIMTASLLAFIGVVLSIVSRFFKRKKQTTKKT